MFNILLLARTSRRNANILQIRLHETVRKTSNVDTYKQISSEPFTQFRGRGDAAKRRDGHCTFILFCAKES